MYKPKYTLSSRLLVYITQIERLYGQIEALQIPSSLELNLVRDNMVQSSYSSNKIEGNPLTLPEVTNLLLDDRIPVNRSEKEIVNYFDLLKRMSEYKDKPFDLSMVLDFHKQLMNGVDKEAGNIRNTMVVVGKYKKEEGDVSLRVKHSPPYHTKSEIEKHLIELLSFAQSEKLTPAVILGGIFHHQFVYLHPFEDGNGRVTRLLTSLIFVKHDYLINRYFILDDYYDIDRTQYSDMLHTADNGDKTAWLEYFAEGMLHSLKSALFKYENAVKTLDRELRPTPKEKEVILYIQDHKQVTSPEVALSLGVSRQQAHNLLKSLVEKSLLSKKGSTKSSYYFLK
jgi:Fic family protein